MKSKNKKKDFEIIDSSENDRFMRLCVSQFLANITFEQKYIRCIQEIKEKHQQVKLHNQFKTISSINQLKNKKSKLRYH